MLGNEKGWFEAPEAEDLWRLVTGRLLGSGVYRRVFKCKLDPTLVVQEEGCFHNVREWDTWQSISDAPKWSQWVAPCVAISPPPSEKNPAGDALRHTGLAGSKGA